MYHSMPKMRYREFRMNHQAGFHTFVGKNVPADPDVSVPSDAHILTIHQHWWHAEVDSDLVCTNGELLTFSHKMLHADQDAQGLGKSIAAIEWQSPRWLVWQDPSS